MTLRALERIASFPGFGRDPPPEGGTSRAIIFVLDAGYVPPMKVLWHTLVQSGALADLPVIIATEDGSIFDDPTVGLVADIKFVIDRETIEILESAAECAKKRAGKEAWTRSTFLKWAVFRDWGFDEVLFLDCDMIALGSLSPLFDTEGDIVGSPQFKRLLVRDGRGALRDRKDILERLTRFSYKLAGSPLSLNSGVMVLRGRVLTGPFLREISAFTTTVTCVNEQQYITRFAGTREAGVNLSLVSPFYNFQGNYLAKVSWYEQLRFLRKICVLHFAGSDKPWKRPASDKSSVGHFLWWQAERDARRYLCAM